MFESLLKCIAGLGCTGNIQVPSNSSKGEAGVSGDMEVAKQALAQSYS